MKKPKVIAISGVSGGGKTTIIKALSKTLDAQALYFDDYDFAGAVDDYYQWTIDGMDCNVWNLTPLKVDIERLLKDELVSYILLDYPFAYKNDLIQPYIDYAIFIDTPLDISLARRVLRDMQHASGEEIRQDLAFYLKRARTAYAGMLNIIPQNSDFVVSGEGEISKVVNQLTEKIKSL